MQVRTLLRLSVAVALATIVLKLGAWWLTGSVGLLSDALESFVNLAAALFALWMVDIAAHELAIVKYYVRRGAHVAAARRAEQIIADYPGAPATAEALVLLESSYREAGLVAQADEVRRLREANPALRTRDTTPVVRPGGLLGPPPDPIPEPAA